MKRLFLAIPIHQQYTEICMHFIEAQNLEKVRWINPENWHITLIFIGDFKVEGIPDLTLHLKDYFVKSSCFELPFESFVYKPNQSKPSMIWGKFKTSEVYNQIIHDTYEYLKEFYESQSLPFNISIRPVNIPHITLARLKNEYPVFPKLINRNNDMPLLKIKDCFMFESVLLPKGVEYHLLHSFSFSSQD